MRHYIHPVFARYVVKDHQQPFCKPQIKTILFAFILCCATHTVFGATQQSKEGEDVPRDVQKIARGIEHAGARGQEEGKKFEASVREGSTALKEDVGEGVQKAGKEIQKLGEKLGK